MKKKTQQEIKENKLKVEEKEKMFCLTLQQKNKKQSIIILYWTIDIT